MASARMLVKLVATAGSVSAGAVTTLEGKTSTTTEGLGVVPRLIRLVAETIQSHSGAAPEDLDQAAAYLTRLIRRYGTLRRALDAIAEGRRRHLLFSSEKAGSWHQAMTVTSSAIEPTLRRHASLLVSVTKWLHDEGATIEQELDAYFDWLDAPLPDFDEAGFAAPNEEHSPESVQPESEAVVLGRQHSNADVAYIWRTVFEDKRPAEVPGDREFTPQQDEVLARLRQASDPYDRVVAAVACRDFGLADSFFPHLEGNVDEALLAMLRGHRYELEGRYDEAYEQYRLAAPSDDDPAGQRALAMALLKSKRGSARARFGDATRLLRHMINRLPRSHVETARTAGLLGYALLNAPIGDRLDNLSESVEILEGSLRVLTQEHYPEWWAELKQLLASALLELPSPSRESRETNIEKAIEHLCDSLRVWTRQNAPGHWAAAQSSLGLAYEKRTLGDRTENLEHAVSCYSAALLVRRRESHPIGWARLQMHLGHVWMQFPAGDPRQNADRAIACYAAALEIWSRESRRSDWATAQSHLGSAWAMLPTNEPEERIANLHRAVECYERALEYRTAQRSPVEWASTRCNLGSVYLQLAAAGNPDAACHAASCFLDALKVRTRERHPVEWAKTQANLGQAFTGIAELKATDNIPQQLSRAVQCFEYALTVFDENRFPSQNAHVRARLEAASSLMTGRGGSLRLADD
ncbi:MAG: hypothetical protein ACF8MJ_01255 [Phycisphaerales bacterium JB050]